MHLFDSKCRDILIGKKKLFFTIENVDVIAITDDTKTVIQTPAFRYEN